MRIERFLFGMFEGKIGRVKTDGVMRLITDKNFQYLTDLTVEPENGYLWLPTEQVVALPHIITVHDEDGREFRQNETFLLPVHDYIKLTLRKAGLPFLHEKEWPCLPETLEPLEVNL